MLSEIIGTPAVLEQTAEEAIELAHACLEYARYLRDDNKAHEKSEYEHELSITKEAADMLIYIDKLKSSNIFSDDELSQQIAFKLDRMA